jgi:hypothetical protein
MKSLEIMDSKGRIYTGIKCARRDSNPKPSDPKLDDKNELLLVLNSDLSSKFTNRAYAQSVNQMLYSVVLAT